MSTGCCCDCKGSYWDKLFLSKSCFSSCSKSRRLSVDSFFTNFGLTILVITFFATFFFLVIGFFKFEMPDPILEPWYEGVD